MPATVGALYISRSSRAVPVFAVRLVTDAEPPTSSIEYLDELLDALNDAEAWIAAPDGRLEVRAKVNADDVVGAIRCGHSIASRVLLILGKVETVLEAEARTVVG